MQIVEADVPEARDVSINRDLEVIVVISAIKVNAIEGAEVSSALVAGAQAHKNALPEPLLHREVNVGLLIVAAFG